MADRIQSNTGGDSVRYIDMDTVTSSKVSHPDDLGMKISVWSWDRSCITIRQGMPGQGQVKLFTQWSINHHHLLLLIQVEFGRIVVCLLSPAGVDELIAR